LYLVQQIEPKQKINLANDFIDILFQASRIDMQPPMDIVVHPAAAWHTKVSIK
jgi:hypothetical protein